MTPDETRAYMAAWRAAHPGAMAAYMRRWRERHPCAVTGCPRSVWSHGRCRGHQPTPERGDP